MNITTTLNGIAEMKEMSDIELIETAGGLTGVFEAALVVIAGLGALGGAILVGETIGDWLAGHVEPMNVDVGPLPECYYSNMPAGVQ